jgi:UDPglucose--hexose-1-phosphate uridylyltransferase
VRRGAAHGPRSAGGSGYADADGIGASGDAGGQAARMRDVDCGVIKTRVDRADGRYLYYFSFEQQPPPVLDVRSADRGAQALELRWNPLLYEDVIVSTARQERTFLPPEEHCPLCPTARAEGFATEIPSPAFELVAFENRFPSFRPEAPAVEDESPLYRRAAARGVCEVIVYSPDHDATLATLPEAQSRHLVDVWADRYGELGARTDVKYVFIFENRGREIGVTLTHPHGQIYAFPYVPPHIQREEAAARHHQEVTGRCLLCDLVADELVHGRRIIAAMEGWVAWVPFAARVPYEVHVASAKHRASLLELSEAERTGLARIVRVVQAKYDNLWGFAMPYTMSMHQRRVDGPEPPGAHLHLEFLPPYRARDRLKYFAGVETGAGTYINDTAPEDKAQELREAPPRT